MPIKTPNEISAAYYQFVDKFTQSDFEDEKLLGKFYTDFDIAGSMMRLLSKRYVRDTFSSELRIIDPFCGDGRLIISLLSELQDSDKLSSNHLFISIWDIDANAVDKAKSDIEQFCESAGLKYELDARQADAFVEYYAVRGKYDICVTNPPWSLLKPQKLFSKSNGEEAMVGYRNAIEQYDSYMKEAFTISQPSSKFGKWGTNLARYGTEVALRLIKSNGFCGIVSPASLLNDQVSNKLRSWIFENYKVINVSYYPAELKLYGSADISSITIVVKGGETDQSLSVRIYSDKDSYKEKKIEKAVFEYIKRTGFCIPLKTGIEAIPIMMYLEQLPSTDEFCAATGLSFTRELDETRVKEKLLPTGKIEFAKGYMVDRYSFTSDQLFLNEEMVIPPPSSSMSKVVWRDVSRDSQVRRIKATLLPPGFICGNSLGVVFGDETAIFSLKMLLAIMNSMIFEYQARSMLVSNHVSAGIVKQIRVPRPSVDMDIIELVDKQLADEDVEDAIELAVAHLYNLSADEYEIILDSFKLEQEKRTNIVRQYREKSQDGEKKAMIFNHYASSLSELDMQVIKCVPPGGNWKNIPESIPSQRLAQIRESYKAGKGSRSTYYGRLRPDMPAYTINTYFNRPGNGCHMHYDQDRTISQREAARFQSFPDSFEFIGSLGAINNQIGNAVPPLLAYQIAKNIPFKGQFVDLFCGAGGLALGFIWAGWTPIIGNDIDKYAVEELASNHDGDDGDADNSGGDASGNRGALILDATCCPQNIRFPTDASLLNESRELLEGMIDTAHEAGATEGRKPRTYRNLARRDWLRFVRDRKPTRQKVRKALRQQLGYVKRDLGHLDTILVSRPDVLSRKQLEYLAVVRKLYEQQREMYENKTHRVDDRIVSLHQPWVRPIVRGKAAVPVEFGAKVALSLSEGYARIEEISWDAFNEGKTLIDSMERYKEQTGKYPERALVDRIYRTRENLAWCRKRGIRINGPKLGRPPKDRQAYLDALELERLESGERNEIEGCIGVCKRRYGLDLVMMRLKHTSEVDIHVSILTRNLFRRLKSLFCLVLDWVSRGGWGRKMEDSVLPDCLAA